MIGGGDRKDEKCEKGGKRSKAGGTGKKVKKVKSIKKRIIQFSKVFGSFCENASNKQRSIPIP